MPRTYDMSARAAEVDRRRAQIVAAAVDLFLRAGYDEVSLQAVADRAGVGLKTVVRHFGTKDALLGACVESGSREERERRAVPAGDLRAAVRVLAERYDELADGTVRFLPLEDRIAAVGEGMQAARSVHMDWLEATFAPWLPEKGEERTRRLAALYGATEILVWWTWRRRLGYSRAACESAMLETLTALCARWKAK